MNKIYGSKNDYAPVKREGTQIVVCYGYEEVGKNDATWFEVSLPAEKYPMLSFADVKDVIENDINAQTDEKILTGFVWTTEGGDPIKVWLSMENQSNYSEAYHIAERKPESILPVTFKLGELPDKTPVYHTFETFEELESFYLSGAAFKNQCLNEGWARKDNIDWAPYEALFPKTEGGSNA